MKLAPVLWQSLKRFDEGEGWARSSHIALSLLIALFPFCTFTLALAVQLSDRIDSEVLLAFVLGPWPDQFADPIAQEIKAVLESERAGRLTISAVLTLVFASNGIDAIRRGITSAYHETDERPFWKTRLLCIAFVIIGSLVLGVVATLLIVIPEYMAYFQPSDASQPLQFLSSESFRFGVALVLLVLLLISCHLWLPGKRPPLRTVLPGVCLTIVLWGICAQGFSIYISSFSSYSVTYAGLAGIMASLVFMYLMAALFLFGAEFNGQLAENAAEARKV